MRDCLSIKWITTHWSKMSKVPCLSSQCLLLVVASARCSVCTMDLNKLVTPSLPPHPLSRAYTPKLRSQNLVDILCLLKWWEAKIMCWFGQQLAGSRSRGHEKMLQAALITLHAVQCNYTWPLLGQQQSNVKLVYHFAMKTIQPTKQLPNDFIPKLN